MKKIKAIVIDDEIKSREVIKALLVNFCTQVEVIGEAGDIKTGVEVIQKGKPDLVFLDITLKEGDSFQILKQLGQIDFDIIFVTAYDEYSVKALKFSGITCLFKPLDIEELQEAVKLVTHRNTDMGLAYEMVDGILKNKFKKIPIVTTSGLQFTDVSEIMYLEQKEHVVEVRFRNGEHTESQRSIEAFADIIFSSSFERIGSRLMVNKVHLERNFLNGDALVFRNNHRLTLTRDEMRKAGELK